MIKLIEPGKYFIALMASDPAFDQGDEFVGIVADKVELHDLWLALREFRGQMPKWRKKGKTCPAPECGVEIDDRADTCRTHGCGRKPKDGKKKEPSVVRDYQPPKGLL